MDLSKRVTGINAIIWASVKYASDSPIVIVATREEDVTMSIEDEPRIIPPKKCKKIPGETLDALKIWIVLNKQVLLQHWRLESDSVDLVFGVRNIKTLKKLQYGQK